MPRKNKKKIKKKKARRKVQPSPYHEDESKGSGALNVSTATTDLLDFASSHVQCENKTEEINTLFEKFQRSLPPTFGREMIHSPHHSDLYKDKEGDRYVAHMCGWLSERQLKTIVRDIAVLVYAPHLAEMRGKTDDETCSDNTLSEQPDQEDMLQKTVFLYRKALYITLLNLGNCASRASHCAMEFRKALPESIQICVKGYASKDHFVVTLATEENLYTYDPLLNPYILFDSDYYDREILPQYISPIEQQPDFGSFEITRDHCSRYEKIILPSLRPKILKLFHRFAATNILLPDYFYIDEGLKDLDYPEKMEVFRKAKTYILYQIVLLTPHPTIPQQTRKLGIFSSKENDAPSDTNELKVEEPHSTPKGGQNSILENNNTNDSFYEASIMLTVD